MPKSIDDGLSKEQRYRLRNLEKCKKYSKEYYHANKVRMLANYKQWKAKNVERVRELKRLYYRKLRGNKDTPEYRAYLAKTCKWKQANKDKIARSTLKKNMAYKAAAIAKYSNGTNACASCAISDIDVLTLDHINGGGRKHRAVIKIPIYIWVKTHGFPDGFQVLCMNCNWKKHLTDKRKRLLA